MSKAEHMCVACNRNTAGCERMRLRDNTGKFVASIHTECIFDVALAPDTRPGSIVFEAEPLEDESNEEE